MPEVRLAVILISLILTSAVKADSERYKHWSEGVYFPPQTDAVEAPINSYPPAEKRRYNPWTVREEGKTQQQLPTAESLGYPSTDYNPYQSSARGRKTPSGRLNTYVPRHGYPPAAGRYYPEQYGGSGADINAYSSEYPRNAIGRGYELTRPYPPAYSTETYHPVYGMGLHPWISPFTLYGSSFLFLPDW